MKKIVWTYGLVSGALASAALLLSLSFADGNANRSVGTIGYVMMVLSPVVVYLGMRSYRDRVGGGTVRFGRALAVGALIVLVASTCFVATWELVFFRLNPGIAAQFAPETLALAESAGDAGATMQNRLRLFQNPAINAGATFLAVLPTGLAFVLVSARVLSRKRRSEQERLTEALA
jgi:hypothetical protein